MDLIYGVFNKLQSTTHRADVAGRIREMMTGNSAPEKISVMSQYLAMLETDIESEDRFEDEAWFDGTGYCLVHFSVWWPCELTVFLFTSVVWLPCKWSGCPVNNWTAL